MKLRLQHFILVLWLTAPFLTYAQTALVKGLVVAETNGRGVAFASVALGNVKLKTDSLGVFVANVSLGKTQIKITAIGFKSHTKWIDINTAETTLNIVLEPVITQLDEFVYTGGKVERKAAQEVMSMNIIKPNLIAYTNATDLSDVVNKVPGVSMIEGQVAIRAGVGYSYSVGSRVMVMLDDMPLMGADLGDVRWKLLPIEAAEQVEVVKGATSVLYGSAALNGSINVRTGWAGDKPETKVNFFQGITGNPNRKEVIWWERTAQPFQTGMFASHRQKFGNFDLLVSGNVYMVRSHLQLNDEYRGRTYIKTRYRSKKVKGLSFGINSLFMAEKAGRFFLWENLDSGAFKPYAGSAGQDFWRIYTIDPHITYVNPNGKSMHAIKLRSYNIVRFVDTTLNRNLNNADAQQYGFDYSWMQKLAKPVTLTSGFYGTYITAVGNVYEGRYQGYSYAFYSQVDYMRKRWSLSAGARYEVNRIDSVIENRRPLLKLGANYQAASKTFIRLNYGEGYRFPTIGERYVDDGVENLKIFPNPALQTEFGWTAELGLKQGFRIANFNAQFDYAFFWQEYTDLIEFKFDQYVKSTVDLPNGVFGFKALNLQQARVAGMEFDVSGSGNIGEVVVNLVAGYSYAYPVNLAADSAAQNPITYLKDFFKSFNGIDSLYATQKLLPYRNRQLLKFDAEFNYRKVNFGYGVQFYSRFENIDPLLYVIIPDLGRFMSNIGTGDWVHQVRFGVNISQQVTLSFLVNNLTNLEYATRPAKMDAPRNFILQLRVRI